MEVLSLIKDDKIRLTISLPEPVYKAVQQDAEYEDRSMSNVIVRILKKYYKIKIEED